MKRTTYIMMGMLLVGLHLASGRATHLCLNLDKVRKWTVDAGSFDIDTEHLPGSRRHSCLLQKGEARRLVWQPLGEEAKLEVTLTEASEITTGGGQ